MSIAMRLRLLSTILLAMAMFLSPIARVESGAAASASEMGMAASVGGHCADTEQGAEHKKSGMSVSCATACAALQPMSAVTAMSVVRKLNAVPIAGVRPVLNGIPTEFDTPPPRAELHA